MKNGNETVIFIKLCIKSMKYVQFTLHTHSSSKYHKAFMQNNVGIKRRKERILYSEEKKHTKP